MHTFKLKWIFSNKCLLKVPEDFVYDGISIEAKDSKYRNYYTVTIRNHLGHRIVYSVYPNCVTIQRNCMHFKPIKGVLEDHIFCKLRHVDNEYTKSLLKKISDEVNARK